MKKIVKNILYIFLLCMGPFGWLILYMIYSAKKTAKTEAEREAIYNKIISNPCESYVNELIEFINIHRMINNPEYWNKLRGVWFVVNESPNISTETKYRFRDFLMTKGLRITGRDKEVIKNHK